jgi:hypothetical protein
MVGFSHFIVCGKGCPTGKVRMYGAECGIFRGPFGCCRKQLHFSDLKLGGKRKSKKIKSN